MQPKRPFSDRSTARKRTNAKSKLLLLQPETSESRKELKFLQKDLDLQACAERHGQLVDVACLPLTLHYQKVLQIS